jgi:hypothetical protein
MTVDIRAKVICSLGQVIEASISDDLLSETGLIRTTGEVTIQGLRSFGRGRLVEFAYIQAHRGTVSRFPRALRVIKSTADPYAKTTRVELGCKLAMSESIKLPDVFKAVEHPPEWWHGTVRDIVPQSVLGELQQFAPGTEIKNYQVSWPPPPVSSKELIEYCLRKIGISSFSGTSDLTFHFMRPSVDLSSGYVQVIGDLLISHCLYGRLNAAEVFKVSPIDIFSGRSGPTVTDADLINLEPISGGEDPAGTVMVSFNSVQGSGTR